MIVNEIVNPLLAIHLDRLVGNSDSAISEAVFRGVVTVPLFVCAKARADVILVFLSLGLECSQCRERSAHFRIGW